jgi:hypothetical protein
MFGPGYKRSRFAKRRIHERSRVRGINHEYHSKYIVSIYAYNIESKCNWYLNNRLISRSIWYNTHCIMVHDMVYQVAKKKLLKLSY